MPKSPYYGSTYFNSPYFGGPGGQPVPEFEDYSVTLRKGIYDLIVDGKTEERFIFNNFTVFESWLPYRELSSLKKDDPNGRLYLVAYPFDEQNISRSNVVRQEVPVLVGFQIAGIDSKNMTVMDRLKSFVSQVAYVCRHFDPDNYSYVRTEALKDEDGLPFAYENITKGIFEIYFIVYYNMVVV